MSRLGEMPSSVVLSCLSALRDQEPLHLLHDHKPTFWLASTTSLEGTLTASLSSCKIHDHLLVLPTNCLPFQLC